MSPRITANAESSPAEGLGAATAFALMSVILSCPLALYNFLLVERKWGVLRAWDQFFSSFHLAWWETVLYVAVFFFAILVLVVTVSAVAHRLLGWWAAGVVAVCYFFLVTAQFEVLRYFRDELSLALVRKIGGGGFEAALAYMGDEAVAMVPLAIVLPGALVVARKLVRRYFRLTSIWLGRRWLIGQLATVRGLVIANLFMAASVPAVAMMSQTAHNALQLNLAHRVYAAAVDWASDVDRDGYGWLGARTDFAPWDAARHPYAIEVAGNGVDENGVGGDLPSDVRWPARSAWTPVPDAIERKNVLLVVMDSARADLASDRDAMPTLNRLPGNVIPLISHGGRTVPSVTGMFNATIAETERAPASLIDIFNKLGYQTAVFSGQHEGFGGIAARTAMRSASVFFDASMDLPHRMHGSTTPAALTVPAPVVTARFRHWYETSRDRKRPFFAYLNWQEMHFPYAYPGVPRLLVDTPIPRASIGARHGEWVRATYRNAARVLDDQLAEVLSLAGAGALVVVLGDHGEELFDRGYLGHGIDVSMEQNFPMCKVSGAANSVLTTRPVGMSDVPVLIHNALVTRGPKLAYHAAPPLCYVGAIDAPAQVGMAEPAGSLIKFDFAKDTWTRQFRLGGEFSAAKPDHKLIHLWESYLAGQQR